MGAFEGLRVVRRQLVANPNLELPRSIEIILTIDADARGLDFEAALELHRLVQLTAPLSNPQEFYRCCIREVILAHRLSWARAILRGRNILLNQLSRDERQCFRSARLLDDPPSSDVVSWWDDICGQIRFATDQEQRERARRAEKLTIDHEISRLNALGIALMPKWVALDDNGAGYDVLSYDVGDIAPVNRLIEVKSTVASPLRFYISRNEWETALKRGSAYVFHIWDMATSVPTLFVREVEHIRPHIPSDNENGKWSNAVIPLGAG